MNGGQKQVELCFFVLDFLWIAGDLELSLLVNLEVDEFDQFYRLSFFGEYPTSEILPKHM